MKLAKQNIQEKRSNENGYLKDSHDSVITKLFPTETMVIFVFVDGLLSSSETKDTIFIQWLTFAILALINIPYLKKLGVKSNKQILGSVFLFSVFVYAIGGPFAAMPSYDRMIGSTVLALATFVTPLFFSPVSKK